MNAPTSAPGRHPTAVVTAVARFRLHLWCCFLICLCPALAEPPTARVGQPLVIEEILIPGGQLQPAPRRDRTPPLVVRILDIRSAENGFRYDFEVTGLDPGTHDLATYLEPVDPTTPATIPPLEISITTALPDTPPRPHALEPTELPGLGGYRTTLIVFGVIWLVGLIAILLWRKKKPAETARPAPPPTLAERLRPLVTAAATGALSRDDRALLDRLVIGHWRHQLPGIADLPPAEALVTLRRHPQASPLLLALEKWLHSNTTAPRPSDIEKILSPYTNQHLITNDQ